MALLNPPEIRLSVITLLVEYLARRRGSKDDQTHLIDTVAPPSLSKDGKHQLDVRVNLTAALDIGLLTKEADQVRLRDGVAPAAKSGSHAIAAVVRQLILADENNVGEWGSQAGARDLTNAIAWFLTFSPTEAPARGEGARPSAKEAQERDFGPRQPSTRGDDDAGGWLVTPTRWPTFQRWACSLGFAWRSPSGRLVPDPTSAVRNILPSVFEKNKNLPGQEFVAGLGRVLPVMDTGRYRTFVQENWHRAPSDPNQLSSSTTDALERLSLEGSLTFEDRADAPRVSRFDGSTFSHVRIGGTR